jgi:hypothetical protein
MDVRHKIFRHAAPLLAVVDLIDLLTCQAPLPSEVSSMRHTPSDPALCPKCGGVMRRFASSTMMVCENTLRFDGWAPSPVIFGMSREPRTPTCDQDPMYLVPADA